MTDAKGPIIICSMCGVRIGPSLSYMTERGVSTHGVCLHVKELHDGRRTQPPVGTLRTYFMGHDPGNYTPACTATDCFLCGASVEGADEAVWTFDCKAHHKAHGECMEIAYARSTVWGCIGCQWESDKRGFKQTRWNVYTPYNPSAMMGKSVSAYSAFGVDTFEDDKGKLVPAFDTPLKVVVSELDSSPLDRGKPLIAQIRKLQLHRAEAGADPLQRLHVERIIRPDNAYTHRTSRIVLSAAGDREAMMRDPAWMASFRGQNTLELCLFGFTDEQITAINA